MFRSRVCVLLLATAGIVFAQNGLWTGPVRGSWVFQGGQTGVGDLVLSASNITTEIVVADDEGSNVKQAAEFLAGDIEKISGHRPAIVKTAGTGNDHVAIRMVTLGHGQIPSSINIAGMQGQWESYKIVSDVRSVWLVGSNARGTAFAAYTLSERLGIDPLYIWTNYQPEHHDPLILKRTNFSQAAPTFKYRGFFHDDEDLLPRPFDANGNPLQTGDVPLDWYKRFFETALRLRMNMVAPYTRVHRRYEVQKLASDWGLYYTSHHYDILVSNPFGLTTFNLAQERGVKPDYNWFTNKEGMLKFWRGGVEENKDIDVIWPVGMRGTSDRPFTFPQGTTDEQKIATFKEVIADQVAMTRDLVPKDKPPLFHFTMYSEMLPIYQQNPAAFDLPSDVIIVWPDDNDGHMRGLPPSLGKWKHGVYYHLAYLGGNLSKQTVNTVRPKVVSEEFEKIVKAGATEYMLVNMSEVRDYIMSGRMLADIVWDAPAAYAQPNAPERFTSWWSREYFQSNAPAVDTAYNKLFNVLNVPSQVWQAMDAIQYLVGQLYNKVQGNPVQPFSPAPAAGPGGGPGRGGFAPPFTAETLSTLQSRAKLLEDALAAETKAESGLNLTQQRFLQTDVALGLQIALYQTQSALKLEEALRAPDAASMWKLVFEARTPLEQVEAVLARGEYPPFDRWYAQSWIRSAVSSNNPHRAYNQLRAFIGREGHGAVNR